MAAGESSLEGMTLEDFPELKRLSPRSRLKMAEELWDSAASDALPVPAAHKALLRGRRAAYERGEIGTLTLAELKRSIRRRP
ncbi:MAG: addiction module protein [Undibacterium sp.]|nr:addiction module protein [Opitutaceae bacterium]